MSEELFLEYETDASSSTGTIANDKRFSDINETVPAPVPKWRKTDSVWDFIEEVDISVVVNFAIKNIQ